ncbi:MAG: hypothetical protein D6679_14000 [Candidatus Hydrogenedentota bacterium]|nr:MAG: hypothetical protein D6679_14000 [Candidatus Hydrogenedentota bacterium]
MKREWAIVLLVGIFSGGCSPAGSAVRRDDRWANLEANAVFDRAEQYYAMGRYSSALVEYRKYLDRYADLYRGDDASFRTAQCLEAMGERIEAADVYRATAMLYSRSSVAPAALLRSGELYEMEGWLEEALWSYRRAMKYYPDTEPGKTAKGRYEVLRKRVEEETKKRRKVRRFPPEGKTLNEVIQGK